MVSLIDYGSVLYEKDQKISQIIRQDPKGRNWEQDL